MIFVGFEDINEIDKTSKMQTLYDLHSLIRSFNHTETYVWKQISHARWKLEYHVITISPDPNRESINKGLYTLYGFRLPGEDFRP